MFLKYIPNIMKYDLFGLNILDLRNVSMNKRLKIITIVFINCVKYKSLNL